MTAHDYKPTPEDLRWARETLEVIKDGGTLIMPGALMIWRVDHSKKVVVLINSDRLDTHVGRQMYLRTKATLEAIGYVVAPA